MICNSFVYRFKGMVFFCFLKKSILCFLSIWVIFLVGCDSGSKKHTGFYPNKTAVKVSIDQMVFLKNENGASLIDIKQVNSLTIWYRWRSWNKSHTNELSGNGRAEEKLRPILAMGGSTLYKNDKGTDFVLTTGYVNVLWMPCSSNSVWLYYSPEKTSIKLLSDKEFDDFKVSEAVLENAKGSLIPESRVK